MGAVYRAPTSAEARFVNRLCVLLVAVGACARPSLTDQFARATWVDLTYPFDSSTIYWPTAKPFRLEVVSAERTAAGYYYAANNFAAAEHGGTHLDAPVHFAEGMLSIDQIRTGWGSRWPDRARYLGTTKTGPAAVAELHFPGIHPDAARWLVTHKVRAVGIDTPSIDYGQSTTFDTHQTLFAANIPAFENVAHLSAVPATGAFVIALPMKIRGGSGGPLRIVAVLAEGAVVTTSP